MRFSLEHGVRPQITYQIPLFLIPQVFQRLKNLGHDKVETFLDCLDPIIPPELNEEKIHRSLSSSFLARQNVGHDNYIKLFLKRHVAPVMESLETNKNVKGFCYLFLYYWHTIFNNKKNLMADSEPGPKKSLAVLSRIPLSQIFDKLDFSEKRMVIDILSPIIRECGVRFQIRSYSNYDGVTVTPSTTLNDWYNSIINPTFRKEVNGRMLDLLSPPPYLEDTEYSMGYLDIDRDSSGLPLIEIRGYAIISVDGHDPQINDIVPLITTEANWFFNDLEE